MMDPITMGLLIGGGAGLLKNELVDKPQHKRMQLAEAEKTRYSPWTGMQGQTLTPPSAFGSALQGATTGAMIGQGVGGMGGAGAGAGAGKGMAVNYTPQFQSANPGAMDPSGMGSMWGQMNKQQMYNPNAGGYGQSMYAMG